MSKNRYESLGKYTEASDKVYEFLDKRNDTLSKLREVITFTLLQEVRWIYIPDFDIETASRLLKEAIDANNEIMRLTATANAVAKECNKPYLIIEKKKEV